MFQCTSSVLEWITILQKQFPEAAAAVETEPHVWWLRYKYGPTGSVTFGQTRVHSGTAECCATSSICLELSTSTRILGPKRCHCWVWLVLELYTIPSVCELRGQSLQQSEFPLFLSLSQPLCFRVSVFSQGPSLCCLVSQHQVSCSA